MPIKQQKKRKKSKESAQSAFERGVFEGREQMRREIKSLLDVNECEGDHCC